MKTSLSILGGILISTQLAAFPCVFTFVKSNCWKDYDVTVNLQDVASEKKILSITLPKDKLWARQEFTCSPGQNLLYTATFSPEIWEGTGNRVYKALKYWTLPQNLKAEKAWEIPVCFADAFAEVPLPPKGSGNCSCDFKSIPKLPPR